MSGPSDNTEAMHSFIQVSVLPYWTLIDITHLQQLMINS